MARGGQKTVRRTPVFGLLAFPALLAANGASYAAGTPAGFDILNRATLSYVDGGNAVSVTSNEVVFRVDERLDVVVSWLDGASVPVSAGSSGAVLAFRVTNAGNGPETFALSFNQALGGDAFDPVIASLAYDSNDNGRYDPGIDQAYQPGVNEPVLAADASLTVFLLSDIPGALTEGALGLAALTATARTGTGAPGTSFAGRGENGSDAVVGVSTALASSSGSYVASLATPQLIKTQVITDPDGGSQPLPGALITYTLAASYAGSLPATGAVVEDPIPEGTTYVPGSLRLNGAALTDAADADAGVADPARVRVTLGNLVPSTTAIITFQVRINT